MNSHPCCQRPPRAPGPNRPLRGWGRRLRHTAGLIVPGAILALLPKCPLCFAAYVALGTGFTLSYTSAHFLLRALTFLCISVLVFCAARRMMRYLHRQQSFHPPSTSTQP